MTSLLYSSLMHVKKTTDSDTQVTLTITADESYLKPIKEKTLKRLGSNAKIPGFRQGKAPLNLLEKNLDPSVLQTEFLEAAVNQLYIEAIDSEKLRPVERPEVAIKKFVPFTTIEIEAKVPVVGEIKLADYKKIKKTKKPVKVEAKDIEEVIENLKARAAERKDVDRAAKKGDQVWIDFAGTDEKGEPVNGADGKDYPLILGSNTFIPGFEDNLIDVKPGEEREFTLTFPKDYGVKALANRKVTFKVSVTKVQEVVEPKIDDEFAKKIGPFKNLSELKEDIKRQLLQERQYAADRDLEQEIIQELVSKSKVTVPQVLLDEQVERLLRDFKQNLAYRGQTYNEFLEAEGVTEEQYRKDQLEPQAVERVKAGLILSEVADQENLTVTPEELEIRIQLLKGQYQDPTMQAELDKPENRRDIAMRLLTEKTLGALVNYATK